MLKEIFQIIKNYFYYRKKMKIYNLIGYKINKNPIDLEVVKKIKKKLEYDTQEDTQDV